MREIVVAVIMMTSIGLAKANVQEGSISIIRNHSVNVSDFISERSTQTTVKDFQANTQSDAVTLEWDTATEVNSDYFTIERSVNGQHYEVIGMVKGNGNSSETTSYTFKDTNPLEGKAHYRLRNITFAGEEIIHKELITNRNVIHDEAFRVFPVSAEGKRIIEVISSVRDNEKVEIIIVGLEGNIAYEGAVSDHNATIALDDDVQPGVYMVQLNTGNIQKTKRIVIQ